MIDRFAAQSIGIPSRRTLSISQAAKFLNVSAETLRRWDRKGLLKPFRTKGGQRRYSITALEAYRQGERPSQAKIRISEAAQQLGVHPETLRRWERAGEIQAERTNGGQRRYTLDRLEQISSVPTPTLPAPQIPVRTLEQFRPRPAYRFLKTSTILLVLLLTILGWSQLSPLTKERIKRAFVPSVLVPIVDVNDAFEYQLGEEQDIVGLKAAYPLEAPGFVSQTLTVLKESVLNTTRFLGTVFFGQENDYFVTPTGDAAFNSVTSNTGDLTNLNVQNLTVTGSSTGIDAGVSSWAELIGKPTILSSLDSVADNEGNIDLVAGANVTITSDDVSNTITIAAASGITDATTLDGLDSTQFLRSDTNDSYTSGILTFGGGTTLDVSAATLNLAANQIAWDRVSKTGSSLADLTTRSAGDLSSGNLDVARLPTGGNWDLASDLTVESSTLFVGATGGTYSGRVGIGTAAPSYSLEVVAGGGSMRFGEASASNLIFTRNGTTNILATAAGGQLGFGTGGVGNRVLFDYIGNVGIGDTTPDGLLDVELTGAKTASAYGINLSNLATNTTTDGINKYGAYITSTGGFGGLGGTATNNWGLYVDTVSGADSNYGAYFANNVGIGTTTPSASLNINKSGQALRAVSTDISGTTVAYFQGTLGANTRGLEIGIDSGVVPSGLFLATSNGSLGLRAASSGSANLLVDTVGNVGVGTTSPTSRLAVGEGNIAFAMVAAPASAPTAAVGAAGLLTGTFYYRYTYVTANGETEVGPYSSSVTVVSQQVDLTNITVGPTGTTSRRVYRGTGVNTMNLVGTINDNTTTTFTDNNPTPTTPAPFISTIGGRILTNGLQVLASGSVNTFLGYQAGQSTTGFGNTFLGSRAGLNVTSAETSTFVGSWAGSSTTIGTGNTAVGFGALQTNQTATANAMFGHYAGYGLKGNSNTAIGSFAGAVFASSTGTNNVFLGASSGLVNTGSGNVFLGYNSGSAETSSNKLYIENSNSSSPLIYGDFSSDIVGINGSVGIGDITPDGKLDVEPTGAVTANTYGINLSNLVTNADTDGINKYGAYITSTGGFGGLGGTATNNWGLYVDTVSGADLNYGAYIADNVGIGTTAPQTKLHLARDDSSTNTQIEVSRIERTTSGSAAAWIGSYTSSYLETATAGTLFEAGRVGFKGIVVNNGASGDDANNNAAAFFVNAERRRWNDMIPVLAAYATDPDRFLCMNGVENNNPNLWDCFGMTIGTANAVRFSFDGTSRFTFNYDSGTTESAIFPSNIADDLLLKTIGSQPISLNQGNVNGSELVINPSPSGDAIFNNVAVQIKPSVFDPVYNFDGGTTYTNNTTEAQTSGGTPFTVLALENPSNDEFYIGFTDRFNKVSIDIATAGAGVTLSAQYWNGSWSSLTITDGTSNLAVDGTITFAEPGDWNTTSVNGVTRYWIRLRSTGTNITTAPTAYFVSLSTANRFYTYAQAGDTNPAFYINQYGNVGIGTASPQVRTHIYAAQNDFEALRLEADTTTTHAVKATWRLGALTNDPRFEWQMYAPTGSGSEYFRANFIDDAPSGVVNILTMTKGGNVGIGTASPQDKLEVAGSLRITDTSQSGSAWAISRDGTAERGAGAMAVYNGYLYAGQGTSAGTGDVYYFDGNGWNLSRDGTEEYILSMAVYNGKLYVGQGTGGGDADIFVCNPATAGNTNICDNASDWTTSYDGGATYEIVISMAVYNGKFYAGLGQSAAGDGDIIVCNPATAGDATTCDNASDWATSLDDASTYEEVDSLAVFNGTLYAGMGNSAGDGDIYRCAPDSGGDITTCDNAIDWAVYGIDGAGNYDRVRSMAVYNGKLYAGTGYLSGGDGDVLLCNPAAATDPDNCDVTGDWSVSMDPGAAVEEIPALAVYNGKLYAGLGRSADGDGDIQVFNGSYWAISYAGAVDLIDSLAVYNGKLYAGQGLTAGEGDIYTYTEARAVTYPIKFSIGTGTSQNLGNMWFENDDEYGTSGGPGANIGAFKLSHALITTAGLYDVVEDYPTYDSTLVPGEIVAIDPYSAGYVTKAGAEDRSRMAGVISSDPGIRLSQANSTGQVPVALLGRVPVRVDPTGSAFAAGDPLTISSRVGTARKAETAGMVIGRSLENWQPGGKTTVTVFINLSWYEPTATEVAIDPEGEAATVNPNGSTSKIAAETVEANAGIFEELTVTILSTFKKLVAETAEIVSAFVKNLTVEQLAVTDKTSGQATVVAGSNQLTINNSQVTETSKVFVTFRDSYTPATQYWVSEIKVGESFTVTLDQPVSTDSRFDWWIVN